MKRRRYVVSADVPGAGLFLTQWREHLVEADSMVSRNAERAALTILTASHGSGRVLQTKVFVRLAELPSDEARGVVGATLGRTGCDVDVPGAGADAHLGIVASISDARAKELVVTSIDAHTPFHFNDEGGVFFGRTRSAALLASGHAFVAVLASRQGERPSGVMPWESLAAQERSIRVYGERVFAHTTEQVEDEHEAQFANMRTLPFHRLSSPALRRTSDLTWSLPLDLHEGHATAIFGTNEGDVRFSTMPAGTSGQLPRVVVLATDLGCYALLADDVPGGAVVGPSGHRSLSRLRCAADIRDGDALLLGARSVALDVAR